MDQQKLQELYKLHERAKRMERLGNDDEALRIYLEIQEDYFANTSDLYERPAVILERKHRFDEAIALCEKAIQLVEEDKITGTVEQFQKRIDKIKKRIGDTSENTGSEKSAFKLNLNPKNWKFIDWLKALGIFIIIGGLLYMMLPKASQYEDLYIDMSEMERESELEGSPFAEAEPSEYVITETMIETAIVEITQNTEVVNASVSVTEDSIGFGMITVQGTSKDKMENLAVAFVKSLSRAAASEYDDLSGPNALAFGELYEHYDIIIAVGDSPDNILSKGTKNKSTNLINWR